MDLNQLGNIGEFIGGLAVVVSLLYLARQVRQNTRSVRASTFAETVNGWQAYLVQQSVEDLDLMVKLSRQPEALTDSEFLRAYYLARIMFRRAENDFYQAGAGGIEQETLEAYMASFRDDVLSAPGMRALWALQRPYFSDRFAAFLDAHVARTPAQAPHKRQEFNAILARAGDGQAHPH